MREGIVECFSPKSPWPHQSQGVSDMFDRLETCNSVCLTALTGAGKTLMQSAILRYLSMRGQNAIIYNARRPLISQLSRTLDDAGIHHGARAASMRDAQNLAARMQIGSLQTDFARVLKQECWDIHQCDLVIIDECHMPDARGPQAQKLIQLYLANGAKVVGFTGTPLEVNHIYKDLVVAGTKRDMLACGAHVIAKTYAIHQLDVSKVKPTKTGEYSEGDIRREVWSPSIVGYAYNDWRKLNPDCKPTMASAPGVAESIWTAQQWLDKGHKVAHIDANEVWVDGERYKNGDNGEAREQVLEDARKGRFDLITNCEVLAAGIDIPCLAHLILLRPFGKLSNFLQVVGRVIRKSPETPDYVVIQDHVGAVYAHGSPNEERDWEKLFDMSEAEITKSRQQQMKDDKEPEPITCVSCGRVRLSGISCPECGHASDRRVRQIVQKDGALIEVTGRVYKKDRVKPVVSPEQKRWDSIFYASRNSKRKNSMNFRQAKEAYFRQYGERPSDNLKRMPRDAKDEGRRIRDVDWGELT